ncbi:hypothetical protein HJFPF1_13503 [Paramyrothecium foliicola]|nr:hypothetical protein HJFPF1_13503 [Paramyrothecium foliicola]
MLVSKEANINHLVTRSKSPISGSSDYCTDSGDSQIPDDPHEFGDDDDVWHIQCVQLTTARRGLDLMHATKHQHPMTTQDGTRRHQWIKSRLIKCLSTYYARQHYLPPEMWSLVANNLSSHYATINLQAKWKPSSMWQVNLRDTIQCKYTVFEGVAYLSGIFNPTTSHNSKSSASRNKDSKFIYIAENYLGTTRCFISESRTLPNVDITPGLWWKEIEAQEKLTIVSDGIKVRNIYCQDLTSTLWAKLPNTAPRFHYFFPKPHKPAHMDIFTFNDTSTIAYSILWSHGISAIYAHKSKGDVHFYRSWSEGSWLYIPLHDDEFIKQIWQLLACRADSKQFVTSKQRVFKAGVYSRDDSVNSLWCLVESLERKPTTIYLEAATDNIGVVAFGSPEPLSNESCLPASVPTPANPINTFFGDYFSTRINLEGLEQITPCRVNLAIIGLLLLFEDGHQECAGEIRLDKLSVPLQPGKSGSWSLVFDSKERRYPYVSAVRLGDYEPRAENSSIINLTRSGHLWWIWSKQQCYVMYEGQTSPPPFL